MILGAGDLNFTLVLEGATLQNPLPTPRELRYVEKLGDETNKSIPSLSN
jgi:hypothetical protein